MRITQTADKLTEKLPFGIHFNQSDQKGNEKKINASYEIP